MNEELDQLLRNLHLGKIRELLPETLDKARSEQADYPEVLLPLFRAQWH